jgi:hypothetical protein
MVDLLVKRNFDIYQMQSTMIKKNRVIVVVKDNLKIMQLLIVSSLRNMSDNMVKNKISITPMICMEFKHFSSETRERTF